MVRRGILLMIFYNSIAFIEKCNKICEKPLTSCVEIWYDCITSCRGLFFCALFYMGQDLSTIHCRFICALCICGSQNLPQREAQGLEFLRNRNVPYAEHLIGGADMRVKVTLACTECKQRNYCTKKNKKNDPDRLEMNKYCKFCKKHTLHKETK